MTNPCNSAKTEEIVLFRAVFQATPARDIAPKANVGVRHQNDHGGFQRNRPS